MTSACAGQPQADREQIGSDDLLPISVLIPAYNRRDLVVRALRSVAAQRPRRPAEVIVVDDGSTDGTGEAAARHGARVLVHSANRGVLAARRTACEAATQPWLAFLDSDDQWLPHHLDTLWALRGDCVLVAATSITCREDPLHDRVVGPLTKAPIVLRDPRRLLHPQNFITTSAAMARRETVLEVGGFRTRSAEDQDMWIRLVERGCAALSNRVTVVYHVHGVQLTTDLTPTREMVRALLRDYRDRPWYRSWMTERNRGVFAWDEMRDAIEVRQWQTALRRALLIASSPRRLRGTLDLLAWRVRARRQSGRVRRDGGPSVAVLTRRAAPAGHEQLPQRADLAGLGRLRTLVRLVRRPSGVAVVDGRVTAAAARLLGVRPVSARAAAAPSGADRSGADGQRGRQ